MTGSYNWTRNAAKENQENLVVTHDPLIVRPFSEEFERLWAELADI
jgi:phosphatidylserine/phosphatidylglycerophosphate/cardiolipin synthase-like enzyme